ncbi:MAG: MBL fold metallo-hydrolase [Eubacteriales bacterium]|nr:MBL fold metallo-hydrolase [Eubacteriales bacterium]
MMHLRFLGTGAADWRYDYEGLERRRCASLLVDGHALVDFTADKEDIFSGTVRSVLVTHSHTDHFDPEAIARRRPEVVWAHESWAQDAAQTGLPVRAARFGEWIDLGDGLQAMPLPANHTSERPYERACGFLFAKQGLRFLYMTDSAWIPREAFVCMGAQPLDALALDATIGPDHPDDRRVFEHTSAQMAQIMVRSMQKNRLLKPGAPVFLTHMARTLWPGQEEAQRRMPEPFVVCFDGMEARID